MNPNAATPVFVAPLIVDYPRTPSIDPNEIDAAIAALERLRLHLAEVNRAGCQIAGQGKETFDAALGAADNALDKLSALSLKLPEMLVLVSQGNVGAEVLKARGFSQVSTGAMPSTTHELRAMFQEATGALVSYTAENVVGEVDGIVIEYLEGAMPACGIRPIELNGRGLLPKDSVVMLTPIQEATIIRAKQAPGEALIPRDENEAADRVRVLWQALNEDRLKALPKSDFTRGYYAVAFLNPGAKPGRVVPEPGWDEKVDRSRECAEELFEADDIFITPAYKYSGWPVALTGVEPELLRRMRSLEIVEREINTFELAKAKGNAYRETEKWSRGMARGTGIKP